jgi:two-component system, NarL family, nitrate/nitrite response regulator NarL
VGDQELQRTAFEMFGASERRSTRKGLDVAAFHDNEVFRCGLETLFRSLPIVGRVQVCEAPSVMALRQPDVVVLPAHLDPIVLRDLLDVAHQADTKVLLILDKLDRDSVRRVSGLPVDGFLLETELNTDMLSQALDSVLRCEMPVPSSLVRELLSEVKTAGRRERWPRLTPREKATLALLVEGMSNKQIARRLGISAHGAKHHVSNVLAKLNCTNRTEAAAIAIQNGLITGPF